MKSIKVRWFAPVLLPVLVCLALGQTVTLHGQRTVSDTVSAPPRHMAVLPPGGPWDAAWRLDQLFGASADGFLIRSASQQMLAARGEHRPFLGLVLPTARTVFNSAIPLSLNEGNLWAGRGWGASVAAGVTASFGPMTLVVAPEITYQQNREFVVFPSCPASPSRWNQGWFNRLPRCLSDRDTLALPWYAGIKSADLPQRFGSEPLRNLWWGETSLSLRAGPTTVGVATERQWWGPGVHNALVLSSNAPGFPHLFVRTTRPWTSRLGQAEAKWILGALSTSAYFDSTSSGDPRSLSGVVATFAPAVERNLTVGIARVVYSEVEARSDVPSHAADVFLRYNARRGNDQETGGYDQLTSVFARWLFPQSGLELYGEWARAELPSSLREVLTVPQHSRAYTAGLQWARALGPGRLHMGGEVTNLEQSSSFAQRPAPTQYVSTTVPGGYTHLGRTLGAAIGPGSSSQTGTAEYRIAGWHAGVLAGRIRWHDDALVEFGPRRPYSHDVSLHGAVRVGHSGRFLNWTADIGRANRYNYMFVNNAPGFEADSSSRDFRGTTFRLTVSPSLRR